MSALHSTVGGNTLDGRHPQVEKRKAASLDLEAMVDEVHSVDPEVAKRVLRKIDLFLMPAMVIGTVTTAHEFNF